MALLAAHAPPAPDHEAATSAGAAAGVAAPTELAELCCTVVVVFLAAFMWRWWRHHSAYEAEQHARGAGGLLALAPSPLPSPRQREPRRVQRSASFGARWGDSGDDGGGSAERAAPLGRRRSSATDAQQQRRERHAQLMGLLATAEGQEQSDDRSTHAHALGQQGGHGALAHRGSLDHAYQNAPTLNPAFFVSERSQSDSSASLDFGDTAASPGAGHPYSMGGGAPMVGSRPASSGSRYAAQLLKRRGSTAAGSVSPVSRTHSAASQISRTRSGGSTPGVSRTTSHASQMASQTSREPSGLDRHFEAE
jgi:hypothetical protein